MHKLKILSVAAVLAVSVAATLNAEKAEAYTCLRPSNANSNISVNGNIATATFTFPEVCKNKDIKITLVSYKAPNNNDAKPFDQQVYYKSVTRDYNITGRRHISVSVPDCFYQVDLVLGEPLRSFAGGVTYHAQHRFLLAEIGGDKPCLSQPAATAPAQPARQASVTIQNTNINTAVAVAKPVRKAADEAPAAPAPRAAPKAEQLPDTGPGDLAVVSFGVSTTAAMLFAYRRRLDEVVAAIISRL